MGRISKVEIGGKKKHFHSFPVQFNKSNSTNFFQGGTLLQNSPVVCVSGIIIYVVLRFELRLRIVPAFGSPASYFLFCSPSELTSQRRGGTSRCTHVCSYKCIASKQVLWENLWESGEICIQIPADSRSIYVYIYVFRKLCIFLLEIFCR